MNDAGATPRPCRLVELSTPQLEQLLGAPSPCIVLVPVGSVEPHGPHLPLGTDTIISEAAALRATARLAARGIVALVAPPIAYGVTDYAAGFAGAISLPAAVLTSFVQALIEAHWRAGFAHVCLVNSHLEPAHDQALRHAVDGLGSKRVSLASPLDRRWAKTLSAEFKSGACHAGRYETSLVLAAQPQLVDQEMAKALPALDISLSQGIRQGARSFSELGMTRAYTGDPGAASATEGAALLERLAEMIITEVAEGLGLPPPPLSEELPCRP